MYRTFPNRKRNCTNRTLIRTLHTQHCNSLVLIALFHLPVTIPRQLLWTQHPHTFYLLDILDNQWPRLFVLIRHLRSLSLFNYSPRITAQCRSFTRCSKTQAPHLSAQAAKWCASVCRFLPPITIWELLISWILARLGLEPQSSSTGSCVYSWRNVSVPWLYPYYW
jgi:hypothetical protein